MEVATSTGRTPASGARAGAATALKVGLLWHSPNSGNLGVGALTIANMAIARSAAAADGLDVDFTIIGMRDPGPAYVARDEAGLFAVTGRSLISPAGCWRAIGLQDCILDIGGGDSFTEIYGPRRFAFLWLTKMMAIVQGVPLVLSPQTIGPFSRATYKIPATIALTGATAVFARDDVSLAALGELAPRAKGSLSVDVAFALPFEDRGHLRGGRLTRVGVNVSGLLFNEAVAGSNRFGLESDYAKVMHGFLEGLVADPTVEVHLITHVAGPAGGGADDDRPVADQLAQAFPTVIRAPDFAGPCEAKSYISSLDFLVAGRMHACIAAFSAGVPVAPVAYSRKFSGLFNMLGYRWLVPVTGMDTAGAIAFLNDCLQRRDVLAADVRSGMERVGALLDVYRSALRTFFSDVAARR